jgi:UDP-N-acetylglucosamine transferase subunit ALG13
LIFVTVGTQLPFDRLVTAIDAWAGQRKRDDVFAQTGPTKLKPRFIRHQPFIDASEFRCCVERAEVVIAHAGMGSIITALELGKPILVMPRRADLGEHRNDHQLATARRFHQQGRIAVAFDEHELVDSLNNLHRIHRPRRLGSGASPTLLERIRSFIECRNSKSAAQTPVNAAEVGPARSIDNDEAVQLLGRRM